MNSVRQSAKGFQFGDTMRALCLWSCYDAVGQGGRFEVDLKKVAIKELGHSATPYHVERTMLAMVALEWVKIGYHEVGKRRQRYYSITMRGMVAFASLLPVLGSKARGVENVLWETIKIGGME